MAEAAASSAITEIDPGEMESRLLALAESCYSHPALNNSFYEAWRSKPLSTDDVALVARNFYAHVAPTANRLAAAFLRMDSIHARVATAENLNDELGNGNPSKAHSLLLLNMFEDLLSRMRQQPVSLDVSRPALLPATQRLIDEGLRLFSDECTEIGCGALLAQEWHAFSQLVYLYEGMRNYMHYYTLEDFHAACEYFYLHIGATEKSTSSTPSPRRWRCAGPIASSATSAPGTPATSIYWPITGPGSITPSPSPSSTSVGQQGARGHSVHRSRQQRREVSNGRRHPELGSDRRPAAGRD